MERYTVIDSGDFNTSVVENFDPKKLKVKPEDYSNIKNVVVDSAYDEAPQVVEVESGLLDSYKIPPVEEYTSADVAEGFKEDTSSNDIANSYDVNGYDSVYKPSTPWVDKRAEDYKIPVVPFSTPSLSNVVAMNNNTQEEFTSNSVEYYKALLEKEELSPTARKYLEAKIVEIDELDAEIQNLKEKIEKAKETLEQLDAQKSYRTNALNKMEDMLNATSRINLKEIEAAAEAAGIRLNPDLNEFRTVVSRLEERKEETASSIESIESAKDRQGNVLTQLNAEVEERNGKIKNITNNLPGKLKDAADVDAAEQKAQEEATAAQERLESLRNKRAELLKTLGAEAPKKVTGIRNAFDDMRVDEEEKGTARAA